MIIKIKNREGDIVEREVGDLAKVAFSGSYKDLKDIPSIPVEIKGSVNIDSTKFGSLLKISTNTPVVLTLLVDINLLRSLDTVYIYNKTGAVVSFKTDKYIINSVRGNKLNEKFALAALTYVGDGEFLLHGRIN